MSVDRLRYAHERVSELEQAITANDAEMQRLTARFAELEAELSAYRDSVRIDAQMDGPKFMGCNISQLRRAWEMTIAALRGKEEE